ncbi:MAG: endolytic transglycosylase MltG [Lachnospiraceae bacterium]|nr:endolytic transglycosylase MltG [Lachnospiraceae bacterium]
MSPRKVAWAIIKTVFGIVIAAVIMMLVYRFSLNAYDFGYRIFAEEPVSPEPGLTKSVAIVEGKSALEIGQVLKEKGLIRDARLFSFQELFSSYHKKLQPGIYELNTAMTPEEMMAVMAANASSAAFDVNEEEVTGNSETSQDLLDESGIGPEGGDGSEGDAGASGEE